MNKMLRLDKLFKLKTEYFESQSEKFYIQLFITDYIVSIKNVLFNTKKCTKIISYLLTVNLNFN